MTQSVVEPLETRRLLAAVFPTEFEQYMLELMNRARANPLAEASRLGINLTEGTQPGEINSNPKQPLAFNLLLDDAAIDQANWLIDNTTLATFSHSGPGGNQPTDRMIAAGYTLASDDLDLENAAINLFSSLGSFTGHTLQQYNAYFVDSTQAGRGHRIHILADNLKEAGAGIATGAYTHNGQGYQAFCSVIDFAEHDSVPYLTGVAYRDTTSADNFYTPGEGLAGVNIAAVRIGDNKTFSTKTWASGGYTLALEAGTYNIYGVSDSLGGFVSYGNVTVTTQNVKKDFTPTLVANSSPPFVLLANRTLFVNGTSGNDSIYVSLINGNYTVTLNGAQDKTFSASSLDFIQMDLRDGNDNLSGDPGVATPAYVNAGLGDDVIGGFAGNDTITGGAGRDRLIGFGGNDRLNGGTGIDTLLGDVGDDRVYGGIGNDKLFGETGVDRLFGEDGNDYLVGGSSNDKLYGGNGDDSLEGGNQNDLLHGEAGNDTLVGEKGNDTLVGGTGADSLQCNDGNDTADSDDSIKDIVFGGNGADTVNADGLDDVSEFELVT